MGGNVIQEYDNNLSLEYEYVRGLGLGGGIGSILYQKDVDNSAYRYYHYNHKGDVYALTDHPEDANDTEELMALYEYDAWGRTTVQALQTNVTNEFRFSTKQHDESTGLVYFGARYYDPMLARWTQMDPAGAVDGLNVYPYVGGQPISRFDPRGGDWKPIWYGYHIFWYTYRDSLVADCPHKVMGQDIERYLTKYKVHGELSAKVLDQLGELKFGDFYQTGDWNQKEMIEHRMVEDETCPLISTESGDQCLRWHTYKRTDVTMTDFGKYTLKFDEEKRRLVPDWKEDTRKIFVTTGWLGPRKRGCVTERAFRTWLFVFTNWR